MVATQIFFYFHPYLGKMNQICLIFFNGVETTNQESLWLQEKNHTANYHITGDFLHSLKPTTSFHLKTEDSLIGGLQFFGGENSIFSTKLVSGRGSGSDVFPRMMMDFWVMVG